MSNSEKLRREFDQAAIAVAARENTPQAIHRRGFLYEHIPARCEHALDIGCGLGDFARFLAGHSDHVLGLDLSPEMIRIARERSVNFPNVKFLVADALNYEFPADRYDVVGSFMTLHHMPLDIILGKIKATLKPGGVFINFEPCEQSGAVDNIYKFYYRSTAFLRRLLLRILGSRPKRDTGNVWHHDSEEVHPRFADVRQICARIMPGASVREHHGLARYSIVWRKP